MKILFYRYGSICEPDLIEQFKRLKLEVIEVSNEINDKHFSSSNRIEVLSKQLLSNTFLFVFSINFFPSISDLCEILNVTYVGWVVDAPVLELFTKSVKNCCNRIFCFDFKQYTLIYHFNPNCIFHLPLGTNVSRWDNITNKINDTDVNKYASDISFVGSLYTEKDPYLAIKNPPLFLDGYVAGLYNCQKHILGTNIIDSSISDDIIFLLKRLLPASFVTAEACLVNMDRFIASHYILDMHCSSVERMEFLSELANRFNLALYTRSPIPDNFKANLSSRGGVSTLNEMPKVFNLSKINLNMTIHSIESGASLRIWDIMGCGGFLLTNYQSEIDEMLIAGTDYDYFTCLDELIEKCGFYLKHDDIRARIALNGYQKTKTYHTYEKRFTTLFSNILGDNR